MKAMLVRRQSRKLWHYKDDVMVEGPNSELSGDCTGLSGNCTELSGNLIECELTADERKSGVNIKLLVS